MHRALLWVCFLVLMTGCERSNAPVPQELSDEPAIADQPEEVSKQVAMTADLTAIYQRLNVRSLRSSLGPRLKYYCESYLSDYFPLETISIEAPNKISLRKDQDYWQLELLAPNKLRVVNQIIGASYMSSDDYKIFYSDETLDWRIATDTYIKPSETCQPLRADKIKAPVVVNDPRASDESIAMRPASPMAWRCDNFWSNKSKRDPVVKFWMTLSSPNETTASTAGYEWGTHDMLMISVVAPQPETLPCERNKQLRRIARISLYDEPSGTITGALVAIATVDASSALDSVMGWIEPVNGDIRRARFDTIAKEDNVLLVSGIQGDWVNISSVNESPAWLRKSDLSTDGFSTRLLKHKERLLFASQFTFKQDSDTHIVRSGPGSDHEKTDQIVGARVAMLPLELSGEWLRVRYVQSPQNPVLSCGDDKSDFEWQTGWIKWREGKAIRVREEHHYGC